MTLKRKLTKLKNIIRSCESCLIAFSGGVDSTLLLKVCSQVLPKDKILAVTATSPTYPEEELSSAKRIAKSFGVRHKVIKTNELKNESFVSNPVNRCYFCKKELFRRLKNIARTYKLNCVCDASSVSDKFDFRPGKQAKQELEIRSPLLEANLCKKDIRRLSKGFKLSTWHKPSLACLASRVPYGMRISPSVLARINRAESYLRSIGFKQCRLRHYNGLSRIEVSKEDIPHLISKRHQVIDKLKKLGYNYVTVDLQGYRTGSMNEMIWKNKK
jgi:uncharacterized protein